MSVLIQLSGVPGSGKSTLARAISAAKGAVVVDTDVVKSALLAEGIPWPEAGRATYATAMALAADLLVQGHTVVVDSPCRYPELLASGTDVAQVAGVPYGFIELRTEDLSVLMSRLDGRTPRASQVVSSAEAPAGTRWEMGTAEATLTSWQRQLVRPAGDVLVLDAALETAEHMASVEAYLDGLGAGRTREP